MHESETTESKKSLAELSEGLVSIAAILNKHGRGLSLILNYAPNVTFQQVAHVFITTFPRNPQLESGVESAMALQILGFLGEEPLSKAGIARKLGKAKPTRYLNELMARLVEAKDVAYTLPGKPNSRLQKYRLTAKGRAGLSPTPPK